jgi:hypothetical protein
MFSVDTYIAGLPVTTLNGAYNVCSAGADPGICNGGGGSRKKNKLMTFFFAITPSVHCFYAAVSYSLSLPPLVRIYTSEYFRNFFLLLGPWGGGRRVRL